MLKNGKERFNISKISDEHVIELEKQMDAMDREFTSNDSFYIARWPSICVILSHNYELFVDVQSA